MKKLSIAQVLTVIFIVLAIYSSFSILKNKHTEQQHKTELEHIESLRNNPLAYHSPERIESETVTPSHPEDAPEDSILEEYQLLYAQNTDMVGFLSIADTSIQYPVMQTKEDGDYYLNHDFHKQESAYGVPYVSKYCSLSPPSDHIIIYGHNIRGGKMFGALEAYQTKDFFDQHPFISFDTLTEKKTYQIIAVYITQVYTDDPQAFPYYRFIDAKDSQNFDAFVAACKQLSLYKIEETAEYGDKLLSLSTCENTTEDGRLVILAKEI